MGQITLETDADAIATLTVDLEGKVNVMNDEFMARIAGVLDRLEAARDGLRGVVVTSAKSTFLAGGDLALMARTRPGMERQTFAHFETLKRFLRRLEQLGVPVVAAINGTALGGGYEWCLACHHRIAVERDDAMIGLPEVDFGILPAAGGVIRLTHLLGLERALPWLVQGRRASLRESMAEGLTDELVAEQADLLPAAKDWISRTPQPVQPFDRTGRSFGAHRLSARDRAALQTAPAWLRRLAGPDNHAARRIADVAAQSLYLPWEPISQIETRGFVELLMKPEAQSRIAGFFERRSAPRS
jgi:3-hydroxyacyl-CoA dehydrogenase/enoyl-CoA hydratase/3-hydroxybutyryl-CoA epimerase